MSRQRGRAGHRRSFKQHDIDRANQAFIEAVQLDSRPADRNVVRRLQKYQQLIRDLVLYVGIQRSIIETYEWDLMHGDDLPMNQGKAWSQADDEALVEWRGRGDAMVKVAQYLGRTPAACATRLSQLVGIPRDEFIEGYLDGSLDGETVRGLYQGRMKRTVAS